MNSVATKEQIRDYESFVAPIWGGRARLDELFAQSGDYRRAFDDAVFGRYMGSIDTLIPWVKRVCPDIDKRRLFEIGCGTGSSTAAFATACDGVTAFDIAEGDVIQAQARLKSFGVTNSCAKRADFTDILYNLDAAPRVDGVLLFAVLEHMYVSERIETLKRSWSKLSSGGMIIICETPNRLSYIDAHTFSQPFANMLPPDLSRMWADKCVSDAVRNELKAVPPDDYLALRDRFIRIGHSGPSYHEFELALGEQVHDCIVSGEFDPEIDAINLPYRLEHNLLAQELAARAPHVHRAFAMPFLYMALRKP
uniref:Methyltransferase domain-containing protein n=1 Tax=Bosea sp. NBC_00436 TaxID=2969620 RepID=A0A9E7ZNK5_9HYPH